jgi:hypothetical protein
MPAEDAHRDAFWVITVVGGMSLTKALEEAVPAITYHASGTNTVLIFRLLLFGLTAIRFFIGASTFFQEVHIQVDHEKKFPSRNYVVDFSSAIAHFSLLYLMAVNIKEVPTETYLSRQYFFLAYLSVLIFDWLWWLGSFNYSTASTIRKWAFFNSVTAVGCFFSFVAFRFDWIDRGGFEVSLFLITIFLSFPDIMRMARAELP